MNKTKEMIHSSLNLGAVSFVLLHQASEPSMNVNISEMVYCYTLRFQSLFRELQIINIYLAKSHGISPDT